MNDREPEVVSGRFVAAGRISDESGELHDGKVGNVGILH